jgi:hypothetical protein
VTEASGTELLAVHPWLFTAMELKAKRFWTNFGQVDLQIGLLHRLLLLVLLASSLSGLDREGSTLSTAMLFFHMPMQTQQWRLLLILLFVLTDLQSYTLFVLRCLV